MLDPKQIEYQHLLEIRRLINNLDDHHREISLISNQIYALITTRLYELKGRDKKTKI